MRGPCAAVVAFVVGILVPSTALAQATLAGIVRDTSGAVLPGVTVEAASPALIERVRTTITDGSGQYRIIDLRGGTYTVTFTLTGFATAKRAGLEVSGESVITANAEMRVGAVAETVTVTGEAPVVDVESTTRQQVFTKDVINTLPTGRNYSSFGQLLTGVNTTRADPGGASGDPMASLTIHGSRPGDQRVLQNGVNTMTLQAGGDIGIAVPNPAMANEVTVDTSGVSAELSTGGVRINYIPRDGGNTFTGSTFFTFSNSNLQADNLTDELRAKGLTSVSTIKTIYDVNPAFGGPIKKDKVWFFFTGRVNRADGYAANAYYNKNAFDVTKWTYEPDLTRPGANETLWTDGQIRLTAQVTPRNKVALTWDQQTRCSCPGLPITDAPFAISSTTSPEASANFRSPTQRLLHAEWSSPVTNKLLIEAVALHRSERWGFMSPTSSAAPDSITPAQQAILESGALVPVLDVGTGRFFRSMWIFYNNNWVPNYYFRGTVSYVTRGHQLKAGITDVTGFLDMATKNFSPISYIAIPGAPISIIRETTWSSQALEAKNDQHYDLGIFVQDRWTMKKLTLNLGLRFDTYESGSPAQHVVGKTPLTPNRADIDFPETIFNNWKDLTPRFGATYDVRGDGRTAIKVTANKYLQSQTAGGSQGGIAGQPGINPVNRLVNATTRVWLNNGDFTKTPNCDLTNPNANGDCLAMANPSFGLNDPGANQYTHDSQFGWGKRTYNWEFSAGIQHQILPRVSVDVAYFRRIYGNFLVTDNTALAASDYAQFSITAPVQAGLVTSGQQITGLFDPSQIVPATNLTSRASDYGTAVEHWNGVDFSVNARLSNGVLLFGGVSAGRTSLNNCDVAEKVPESLFQTPGGAPNPIQVPLQFCKLDTPFLTSFKLNGSYPIPKVDVIVSATFQSLPGPALRADYTITERSPGVPLVSGSSTVSIVPSQWNAITQLVGTEYGERLNQLDLRFGKIIRAGKTRTSVNLDVFNVLNSSTVTTENPAFGAYRQPTGILLARFFKIGAQFDF